MYTKKRYMVSMLPEPVCSTYDLNSDVIIDCSVGGKDEVRSKSYCLGFHTARLHAAASLTWI
jgi:hypothetical protein